MNHFIFILDTVLLSTSQKTTLITYSYKKRKDFQFEDMLVI